MKIGSVFEGTKPPLSKWFTAIYLITAHKKGISSCQLARKLRIGLKVAWFMIHRIREILGDKTNVLLQNTVEIDESYVGGQFANMKLSNRKKMHEENISNKTAVVGMVERKGKAKFTVIGQNSFKQMVLNNVKTDAIIVTDAHLGFEGLVD